MQPHPSIISDNQRIYELCAGPFRANFVDGELRHLRIGSTEIVRRVFVGVRDCAWGTVPALVSRVTATDDCGGCSIVFGAHHKRAEIDFAWRGRLQMTCDGDADDVELAVSFEMEGTAQGCFRTNRTGICVLHPLESCAGRRLATTRYDGSVQVGAFPVLISPHPIASDVVKLSYEPGDGLVATIEFEGEAFETEDQRNWADGSYKSYCRPLSRPFPYELAEGDLVWQKVSVRVKGRALILPSGDTAVVSIGREIGPLPKIGLCKGPALEPTQIAALSALKLAHLRVDVHLASKQWWDNVAASAEEARSLGAAMELAIHLPAIGSGDLDDLLTDTIRLGVKVDRWLVYRDRQPMSSYGDFGHVATSIRALWPNAVIGGGTIGCFAELNRTRPPAGSMGALAWPVCPQVHSFDDVTLTESLEGLGAAVATAQSFAGESEICVGPVYFWRRPDPFAAGNDGVERPAVPDARLTSEFGAAWTLGCVGALAQAQADSLTLYQTSGPLGVIDGTDPAPVYDLLREIGEFADGRVLECRCNDPLRFAALALRLGSRVRIWIASLTNGGGDVTLNSPFGRSQLRFDRIEVRRRNFDLKEPT